MKKIFLILIGLALMTSCSVEDTVEPVQEINEPTEPTQAELLVGTWQVIGGSAIFIFNADGTFVMEEVHDEPLTLMYEVVTLDCGGSECNQIRFGSSEVWFFQVNGDDLITGTQFPFNDWTSMRFERI